MKKPFVSLKSYSDTAKLVLLFLLSVTALMLFFLPEESVAVFGGDDAEGKFMGLVSLIEKKL